MTLNVTLAIFCLTGLRRFRWRWNHPLMMMLTYYLYTWMVGRMLQSKYRSLTEIYSHLAGSNRLDRICVRIYITLNTTPVHNCSTDFILWWGLKIVLFRTLLQSGQFMDGKKKWNGNKQIRLIKIDVKCYKRVSRDWDTHTHM